MRTKTFNLLTGLSGTDLQSNQTSAVFSIEHAAHASVQAVLSGAGVANGTLSLRVSNDAKNPTNWNTVDSEVVTANGTYLLEDVDVSARWAQWTWTDNTSTAGAVVSVLNGHVKGI